MIKGYKQAAAEYESKLNDPYGDEDEDYEMTKEDYLDWQAEARMEDMKLGYDY